MHFLEGLLAAQRYGWDHAQKVLTLLGIYRREDLLAALERAVRYGAYSAKSIERILAVQARPKTCWDRMAEEEPSHLGDLLSDDPTPPRPATEYQHLLFEESDHDDQTEEKDDTGRGRPRRTLLSIFASGSWTTPRRSRFPCPPRFSTRRWPTPSKEGLSHLNFLELIFGEPAARSRQRAIERRIREAKFREDKNLADFDWKFNGQAIDRAQIEQLATGEFLRRHENLVMVGQSGVGKSHLLQALARRYCELGYRVRYTTSADLLEDLRKFAGRPDPSSPHRLLVAFRSGRH